MNRLNINEELYVYSCAMQAYMEALTSRLKVSSNVNRLVWFEINLASSDQLLQVERSK